MLRALAAYPRVTELALAASHEGVLGPCDDDVEFAFGLDLTLDGWSAFAPASEGITEKWLRR